MPTTAVARPTNSTIVRTSKRPPLALRALGASLRALEAGSPDLAARVGVELMFRTMRHPSTAAERAILAEGERLTVRSPFGRLAAWSFGSGPTVLLVHGWNGRGGQLTAFVRPLVERGFRVVTFDAPGHGESRGNRSSLPDFADAVDVMLDAAGTPFVPVQAIIAHSMGGAAVTYAMSRYNRAPTTQRVRALRHDLPVRRFAFIAPPVDVRDFVRTFTRMTGLGPATMNELSHRVESRFAVRLEDLYAPALAREMNAPMLVVHDEDDREVPLPCGRLLAESWPGATLEVTHGLGHGRILRDPGVVERVVSFVSREPATGS
jgi:pimeloyl-ACP methyl ester carboxylesterase